MIYVGQVHFPCSKQLQGKTTGGKAEEQGWDQTTEGCVATKKEVISHSQFYLVLQTALLICSKFNPFFVVVESSRDMGLSLCCA